VIKQVTSQEIDPRASAAPKSTGESRAYVDFHYPTENETLAKVKDSYPSFRTATGSDRLGAKRRSGGQGGPGAGFGDTQRVLLPYDMKKVIVPVLDNKHFMEVHAHFGANLITGFGRLGGRTVGIVANQPNWLAGCLDTEASVKCAFRALLRCVQYTSGPCSMYRAICRDPAGARRDHQARR
jgi:propionyl-CoA carboxylase beta chain